MDAVFEPLGNNHAKCIAGCVCVHDEWFGPVGCAENGITATNFFETEEGRVMFWRPDELLIFASKVIEGACNVGEVFDKSSVEVTKPQETSYVLYGEWSRPFRDSLDLDGVHFDRTVANEDSKVFDLPLMEFTFLRFEKEVELFQLVEDMIDPEFVEGVIIFRGNDHVVHVDTKPALCNFFLEDVVHHCLEGSGRVGQAEEHHRRFKEAFASLECSFVLIAFLDTNVIISPANVKLREEMFSRKVIDQL